MPKVKRWTRMESFNPTSSKQVLDYLRWKTYPIPKNRKTGKDTADEEAIEKILRLVEVGGYPEDALLALILESRHLQKAIGYLLETSIGRDGYYHPIYTFRPETGRLSAVRPNIQNQPNHGVDARIAKAIRACVVPSRPGWVLVENDWKAMEAVLTGYFAQDAGFVKISQLDSHSYFCAHILKNRGQSIGDIPKPDDPSIMEFLISIKERFPDERFMAKTANLAMGYDIGWKHLSEVVRCTAAEAKEYIRIRDEMYPNIAKWKEATFLEAHTKGYLETPFGYRTYYWNVLEPIPGKPGKFRKGKEAREALAFRPQSSGAAMLREAMLALDQYDGVEFNFLAPIHDAILVECPEDNVERVIGLLAGAMERPFDELGGLAIESEAKVGLRWSEMA